MTGRELRQHLQREGISLNQFYERVADAKGAMDGNRRKNAIRGAKRWVAEKTQDQPLRLSDANQAAVAKAARLKARELRRPSRDEDALGVPFLVQEVRELKLRVAELERAASGR